jgi:hypothetical protein
MDNKVSNFRRNWINGTNYSLISSANFYQLKHRPSSAYVSFNVNPKLVYISYGETPKNARGRGIGTKLRALVTLLGIELNKPVYQEGVWMTKNRVGLPPSTRILQKLGWTVLPNKYATGAIESRFKRGNNRSKVNAALANHPRK